MLVPIRHENMQGRRWPVITIGLIVLNVAAFLGTHWKLEEQSTENTQVKVHILMLAAMHPGLNMPDDVQQFVHTVETKKPGIWKQLQNPNRNVEDAWDAHLRMEEEPTAWQEEMDGLSQRFEAIEASSLLTHYAFVPAHPAAVSYLTANFLHGGWLHLISNMWFLWLAGFVLEDTWGRPIYIAFYLLAGLMALQVHAWFNADSLTPTLGASGAVAALMGGFLVRFPDVKIEMAAFLGVFRVYRFKAAAYWLLPVWLLMEIFSGAIFGQSSGVAHWAHVGGFLFGAAVAIGIRKSGLEQMAEKGIQEKISWVSHPLLDAASEQMEKGQVDEAADTLKKLLQEKPDSVEGWRMLQQIYWRKNDMPAHREALEKLIAVHLKAKETDEALQTVQDFRSAGGEKLAAASWLDLCRQLEDQQKLERAVEEYAQLAAAYPAEKQGLLAQLGAGRLCLKRLNRGSDALRYYEAAKLSPVPHLDWEANIERGIAEAKKFLQEPVAQAAPVSKTGV